MPSVFGGGISPRGFITSSVTCAEAAAAVHNPPTSSAAAKNKVLFRFMIRIPLGLSQPSAARNFSHDKCPQDSQREPECQFAAIEACASPKLWPTVKSIT
jgi:hypothetical protein